MRKKRLKALWPNRGFLIRQNRKHGQLKEFVNPNGSITYLNFVKHFLFGTTYKKEEYKKEFARYTNQMYNKIMSSQEGEK